MLMGAACSIFPNAITSDRCLFVELMYHRQMSRLLWGCALTLR